MNKIKIAVFGLLAAAVFTGCDKFLEDKNTPGNFWVGYADVRVLEHAQNDMLDNSETGVYLHLDNGKVLEVMSFGASAQGFELRDGMRVLVNFSKLGETPMYGTLPRWQVHVNEMVEVLTKAPTEGDGAALADAGIDPRHLWVSGKYLNLTFMYYCSDAQVPHGIDLWLNADHPDADAQNVYVELRHDARGDAARRRMFARASFDVSGLLSEGQNTVTIHFSWKDHNGVRHSTTKLYSPNLNEEPQDIFFFESGTTANIQ